MENHNKLALIILDGWGHGQKDPQINAIEKANAPFVKSLYNKYPNAELYTSGNNVGLPEGQMGNSEVGHLNIGAGRIVYQPLVKINKAIEDHTLHENSKLKKAFKYAKTHNKNVHFLGLVSNGGVHSHIDHLKGLCDAANEYDLDNVYIHAFTDGRDTDPKSGVGYIQELEQHLEKSTGQIASIVGRYYAMDRDQRWERVKKAYDLLIHGEGRPSPESTKSILDSYEDGVTDEFIEPRIITDDKGNPIAKIEDGDVVIFFNFRTDRGRELTMALTQKDFPDHNMGTKDLYFLTMTEYDKTFENIEVLLEDKNPENTLGEVIAKQKLKQLRIAETEKYPHVTYFFSGGREETFEGENRRMIASPKVPTYDQKPSMSAEEVTETVIEEIRENGPDLVVLNYANPDMVGHTGDFDAVVEAVETVDQCAERTVNACLEKGYSCLVTADHGNADFMVNEDGSPNTAHTTNLVPIFLISKNPHHSLKNGKLSDIAPTILQLMNLDLPEEMTGQSLLEPQPVEN